MEKKEEKEEEGEESSLKHELQCPDHSLLVKKKLNLYSVPDGCLVI